MLFCVSVRCAYRQDNTHNETDLLRTLIFVHPVSSSLIFLVFRSPTHCRRADKETRNRRINGFRAHPNNMNLWYFVSSFSLRDKSTMIRVELAQSIAWRLNEKWFDFSFYRESTAVSPRQRRRLLALPGWNVSIFNGNWTNKNPVGHFVLITFCCLGAFTWAIAMASGEPVAAFRKVYFVIVRCNILTFQRPINWMRSTGAHYLVFHLHFSCKKI